MVRHARDVPPQGRAKVVVGARKGWIFCRRGLLLLEIEFGEVVKGCSKVRDTVIELSDARIELLAVHGPF